MTKRQNSKYKICKQVRENIWNKPLSNKVKLFKGSKVKKLGNQSEYGFKLQHKQKLKKHYGNLTEKQFYNMYLKSLQQKGKTGDNLLINLERRLDNIIFRMNFTNSIFHSRQLINHNFILVNGKSVNIPSYQIKKGDLVQVKPNKIDFLTKSIIFNLEKKLINRQVPKYLEVNYKVLAGIVVDLPKINEIWYPIEINPNYVIEYYSGN